MNELNKSANEITALLVRADLSDEQRNNQLMSLVYTELRSMADLKMRYESSNHTLTPTALVHEAYLRLVKKSDIQWQSRKYFFAAAAQAMRRILIDSARIKMSKKRGERAIHSQNIEQLPQPDDEFNSNILDLDIALSQLESIDEKRANVVKLRYFSGLTVDETALAMDISPRSVNRLWTSARAWLIAKL